MRRTRALKLADQHAMPEHDGMILDHRPTQPGDLLARLLADSFDPGVDRDKSAATSARSDWISERSSSFTPLILSSRRATSARMLRRSSRTRLSGCRLNRPSPFGLSGTCAFRMALSSGQGGTVVVAASRTGRISGALGRAPFAGRARRHPLRFAAINARPAAGGAAYAA